MVRLALKPLFMRVFGFLMGQILAFCPNFAQVIPKKPLFATSHDIA